MSCCLFITKQRWHYGALAIRFGCLPLNYYGWMRDMKCAAILAISISELLSSLLPSEFLFPGRAPGCLPKSNEHEKFLTQLAYLLLAAATYAECTVYYTVCEVTRKMNRQPNASVCSALSWVKRRLFILPE